MAYALFDRRVKIDGIYSERGASARRVAKQVKTKNFGTLRDIKKIEGIVILAVPDSRIKSVADELSSKQTSFQGKTIFHVSGALTCDELSSLKTKGASVGSFHPMQTFPRNVTTSLDGIWCAIEGDPIALRVMKQFAKFLGVNIFTIPKEAKVLYHTAGIFASNYVVTVMSVVEEIAAVLKLSPEKIKKIYYPIMLQTMNNVMRATPEKSLTGPIVRGDVETVKKHLNALGKGKLNHLVPLYSALGIETVRLAKRKNAHHF